MPSVPETMIMAVAGALEELVDEVVFVGGCATPLLVDEAARPDARMTEDVDFVIEAAATIDYYRFADRIREKGFKETMTGDGPLSRWTITSGGVSLIVDVMPTQADVLGFSNPWYPDAYMKSNRVRLPNQSEIQLISPLYFLATKFNAWSQRGNGDLFHKDMEDIVFVLEYRPRLAIEFMDETSHSLKAYLKEQCRHLLGSPGFGSNFPGLLTEQTNHGTVVNALKIIGR